MNEERAEMHASSVKNVQRVLATRAASSWLTHVPLAKVTRKFFREYSKKVKKSQFFNLERGKVPFRVL